MTAYYRKTWENDMATIKCYLCRDAGDACEDIRTVLWSLGREPHRMGSDWFPRHAGTMTMTPAQAKRILGDVPKPGKLIRYELRRVEK